MTAFKLTVAAAAAAFLAFSGSAFSQDKASSKSGKVAKQDQQALTRLAQGDLAEIATGKLAQQKAASPEVKKYGEHMVQEHTQMMQKGAQIAKAQGVKPPTKTDKKHEAAMKKLEKLSGAEFDKAYIGQMVKDHEEMLSLAEKTAKGAKDPQLKSHAEAGMPHIKEHLEQAKKLQASLGGGASAGSSGGGRSTPKK